MKIIKELGINPSTKEIKEIYERGNKLAVMFEKDEYLGDTNCVVYDNGEVVNVDKLSDSFVYWDGADSICAKANSVFVIDEVSLEENIAFIKPYNDEGVLTYCLSYKDENGVNKVGDKVYEVEV